MRLTSLQEWQNCFLRTSRVFIKAVGKCFIPLNSACDAPSETRAFVVVELFFRVADFPKYVKNDVRILRSVYGLFLPRYRSSRKTKHIAVIRKQCTVLYQVRSPNGHQNFFEIWKNLDQNSAYPKT